jgi:glycosyltransferase involved in cell wall biosynthesis
VVGIGGNLPVPAATAYKGNLNFLLIAQDFMLKGGDIAFEAFQKVHDKHPEANFYVLGQKPPEYVLKHPNVIYPGYLHKNNPEEYGQFLKILSEAFCLIHPTKSDTIAQVIFECGYFGCPAIAPSRFAIPELIIPNKTGILLNKNFTVEDIEQAMLQLIDDKEKYTTMRAKVREFHTGKYTYEAVVDKMVEEIKKFIPQRRRGAELN